MKCNKERRVRFLLPPYTRLGWLLPGRLLCFWLFFNLYFFRSFFCSSLSSVLFPSSSFSLFLCLIRFSLRSSTWNARLSFFSFLSFFLSPSSLCVCVCSAPVLTVCPVALSSSFSLCPGVGGYSRCTCSSTQRRL